MSKGTKLFVEYLRQCKEENGTLSEDSVPATKIAGHLSYILHSDESKDKTAQEFIELCGRSGLGSCQYLIRQNGM